MIRPLFNPLCLRLHTLKIPNDKKNVEEFSKLLLFDTDRLSFANDNDKDLITQVK